MAVIRVTISREQKAELKKCGKLSTVVKRAIRMYINEMEAKEQKPSKIARKKETTKKEILVD